MTFARLRADLHIQGTFSLQEQRIKIKFDDTGRKLFKMHMASNTHKTVAKSTEAAAKHASIHTAKPREQPLTVLHHPVLTEQGATAAPRGARIGGRFHTGHRSLKTEPSLVTLQMPLM